MASPLTNNRDLNPLLPAYLEPVCTKSSSNDKYFPRDLSDIYVAMRNIEEHGEINAKPVPEAATCGSHTLNAAKIVAATIGFAVTPIGGFVVTTKAAICPAVKELRESKTDFTWSEGALIPQISKVNLIINETAADELIPAERPQVKSVAQPLIESERKSKASYDIIIRCNHNIVERNLTSSRLKVATAVVMSIAAVILAHALISTVAFNALSGSTSIFSSKALLGVYVISSYGCSTTAWIAVGSISALGLLLASATYLYNSKARDPANKATANTVLLEFERLAQIYYKPNNPNAWKFTNFDELDALRAEPDVKRDHPSGTDLLGAPEGLPPDNQFTIILMRNPKTGAEVRSLPESQAHYESYGYVVVQDKPTQ